MYQLTACKILKVTSKSTTEQTMGFPSSSCLQEIILGFVDFKTLAPRFSEPIKYVFPSLNEYSRASSKAFGFGLSSYETEQNF